MPTTSVTRAIGSYRTQADSKKANRPTAHLDRTSQAPGTESGSATPSFAEVLRGVNRSPSAN